MKLNRRTVAALMICGVMAMSACSGNGGKSAAEQNVNQKASQQLETEGAMTPRRIVESGESIEGKTVVVMGKVTHVCTQSGKKCFLQGSDDSTYTMQILYGGEIDTFPRELMYKNLVVEGVVKINKISKEKILKSEENAKERMPEDTSTKENCMIMERCHSVMNQTAKMKAYMEEHNTDYYPVFYVEGRKFLN
ncbi:MAG: hypothetical protein IIU03_10405 [Bacteroidales bacterium]|nr:hypothetical protein [Bacteroidales bacterium]MBQ5540634.1 hypothetical protein [Bacteroidales bacterium]MBR4679025.1 hypothetical protein [Bacteroidales bacterium]MEE3447322.1 hypothetical protein [Bacteroidales bacterium]